LVRFWTADLTGLHYALRSNEEKNVIAPKNPALASDMHCWRRHLPKKAREESFGVNLQTIFPGQWASEGAQIKRR
jgi:hypothetical protein